ncbi:MAG: undecaprenyl-diphosphate phosphatase [Spirochaetia bacterium]|nr:undecaprenyl-diphosphate phosphatase [Spirochaetia bacterium]
MTIFNISILALIQGAAELLPVSSSAHVIVAAKLMGLDPTSPEMTFLLVMLHTGTMFAVIFFFWKSWMKSFFSSMKVFAESVKLIAIATLFTGLVGLSLKYFIERVVLKESPGAEIEDIFGNLDWIALALSSVGIFIIFSGLITRRKAATDKIIGIKESTWIGMVQGICLPFRGFSRSGATISTGLVLGVIKQKAEEFSFALAVVLTPPVILREVMRLVKEQKNAALDMAAMTALFSPAIFGMLMSFVSGMLALKLLSRWLENGKWHYFGVYCLCFSVLVFVLHKLGY